MDLDGPELLALDEWIEDLRVLGSEDVLSNEAMVGSESRGQRQMKAVASPMRVRNPNGLRSPRSGLSTPSSPSKRDMACVAEQRAMEWAAGQQSPRRSTQPNSPAKSGPPSPMNSTLLSPSRRTPKTPVLPSCRDLGYPAVISETNTSSAVERQLDDILRELDEIDRIHDDVCMLAHS